MNARNWAESEHQEAPLRSKSPSSFRDKELKTFIIITYMIYKWNFFQVHKNGHTKFAYIVTPPDITLHSFLQTVPRTQTNNQDLRIIAIMIYFTEGALFHFLIQYIGSQKKKCTKWGSFLSKAIQTNLFISPQEQHNLHRSCIRLDQKKEKKNPPFPDTSWESKERELKK